MRERFFAQGCFNSPQAAEKALKAFLYARGAEQVMGHSVADLAAECARLEPEFAELRARRRRLTISTSPRATQTACRRHSGWWQGLHYEHQFGDGELEREARAAGLTLVYHERSDRGVAVLSEAERSGGVRSSQRTSRS